MTDTDDLKNTHDKLKTANIMIAISKVFDELSTICGDYTVEEVCKCIKDYKICTNNLLKGIKYNKKKLKTLKHTISKIQKETNVFVEQNYNLFEKLSNDSRAFSKDVDLDKVKDNLLKKLDKHVKPLSDKKQGIS